MAYDLFSQSFKRAAHQTFAHMREQDPIYAHVAPDGRVSWYITRYEDAVAVLKDNEHFGKDRRRAFPDLPPARSVQQRINENMLFADPPDHTRLRTLVNQAFTPRRVAQMAGPIERLAGELLAAAGKNGRFDLISQFALPLPVQVICDLLGIPDGDIPQVKHWSQAIISPGGKGLSFKDRRQRVRAFVDYLGDLFDQRRMEPQDDLITGLVEAEAEGERLSEAELSSMVALLLVTGYETTVNLIGNGALALLQHPDQLALLKQEPALWPTAVEELLRFDGPVETSTTRWVCQDIELHGQQLRRGDLVRVVLSSANRDPACCPHPERLDVSRSGQSHLAFGLGIHYCLGAPLARLEGVICLQMLFDHFPQVRLAVPAEALRWKPGVLFRGLEALPLIV